jgi:hypothetical protein
VEMNKFPNRQRSFCRRPFLSVFEAVGRPFQRQIRQVRRNQIFFLRGRRGGRERTRVLDG